MTDDGRQMSEVRGQGRGEGRSNPRHPAPRGGVDIYPALAGPGTREWRTVKKRAHFIIAGRVQGVCYRMYAVEKANMLNLTGWVRNNSDGTVEVLAEGDDEALKKFLVLCRRGPSYASVTDIHEKYSKASNDFDSFDISY